MKKASIVFTVLMILIAAMVYEGLPNLIPTHWGIDGQVDAYDEKWQIFTPAIVSSIATICLFVSGHQTFEQTNISRSRRALHTTILLINIVFFGVLLGTLASVYTPQLLDMRMLMFGFVGLLFIVLGNVLPKTKSNYVIGIRTPWTLARSDVWFKTHRLGGKVFVLGGCCLLMGGLLPTDWTLAYSIAIIVIITAIPCIYSYFCFQHDMHQHIQKPKE